MYFRRAISGVFLIFCLSATVGAIDSCYANSTAYLQYGMNVRESPSADSPLITGLRAGQTIGVLGSQRGPDWCWLETKWGWVAKTGRVLNERPSAPAPPESASKTGVADVDSIPPIPLPLIGYFSDDHKRTIGKAFEFLRQQGWQDYVTNAVADIQMGWQFGGQRCNWACQWGATTYFGHDWWERHHEYSASTMARTLVHEACHSYQFRDGWQAYNWHIPHGERWQEIECNQFEADMISGLPPPR